MSDNIAINVENLTKSYKLYNTPLDRLKEALSPIRRKYHHDFNALRDVSFEVKKGETFGILGKNGAGKSTLLKIITGVLTPTSGDVQVNGRLSALLELGAGFNPELTGVENVYFNGILMGYTREEMDERLDDILAFADIGEFIQQPVKTYSSGMFVRLAFSVATNVSPEILIVDEALSVGDMFFQSKCMAKMNKMINDGVTVLFVSHSTVSVTSLCQKALLLNDGTIVANDTAGKVVDMYFSAKIENQQMVIKNNEALESGAEAAMHGKDESEKKLDSFGDNEEFVKRAAFQRIRNGKADLVNVQLLDEFGHKIKSVKFGQIVTLRMCFEVYEDIHLLVNAFHIVNMNGVSVVYSDTIIENKMIRYVKSGEKYIIDWQFKVSLRAGNYNILAALSIPLDTKVGRVDFCDYVPCALQFETRNRENGTLYGCVHWDNNVEITRL